MSVRGKGGPDSPAGTSPPAPRCGNHCFHYPSSATTVPCAAVSRPSENVKSRTVRRWGANGHSRCAVDTALSSGSHPGKQHPPSAQIPRAAVGRFGSCRPFQAPHTSRASPRSGWAQGGQRTAGHSGAVEGPEAGRWAGMGEREGTPRRGLESVQERGFGRAQGRERSCGGRRMCPRVRRRGGQGSPSQSPLPRPAAGQPLWASDRSPLLMSFASSASWSRWNFIPNGKYFMSTREAPCR